MLDQALSVTYPPQMFFCSPFATLKQTFEEHPDTGDSRCCVAVTLSLRWRRNLFERFGPRHFFISSRTAGAQFLS
jgi:hypothetical protein